MDKSQEVAAILSNTLIYQEEKSSFTKLLTFGRCTSILIGK